MIVLMWYRDPRYSEEEKIVSYTKMLPSKRSKEILRQVAEAAEADITFLPAVTATVAAVTAGNTYIIFS